MARVLAGMFSRMRPRTPLTWVRAVGLVGIVLLLPYQAAPSAQGWTGWLDANLVVLFGVLPLVAFLWLFACGTFGYGSPRREDWPALAMFLVALGIREGYARHAIGDNEIFFFYGVFRHRHSVVHPLFQAFVQPFGRDPYAWMTHFNGMLGALATLPLYLWLRQRTSDRLIALQVTALFAVHPIIVQMAPTDGPYSLMLFTWFSGLALLSAGDLGAREIFGGAVLLGIAATCRAEGALYLVASSLLLDLRALLRAVRSHRGGAALAGCAVLGLIAAHVRYCFPAHVVVGETLPSVGSFALVDVLNAGVFSFAYNDPAFVILVVLGAVAWLLDERCTLGAAALAATLVVVWPVSMEIHGGSFLGLHRLVPACALQTIAAGVGLCWVTDWMSSQARVRWSAALPALGVALYLFTQHLDEIHAPNALTDEFRMLRNHLAPGGRVTKGCTLLSFGTPSRDTDICDFSQVLPGMPWTHCEQEDCVRAASSGGCFYYLRSLSCFFAEDGTTSECRERGRTPSGDLFACMQPRCAQLERALELSPVEERTVDVHAALPGWSQPRTADIGLFRVTRARTSPR